MGLLMCCFIGKERRERRGWKERDGKERDGKRRGGMRE